MIPADTQMHIRRKVFYIPESPRATFQFPDVDLDVTGMAGKYEVWTTHINGELAEVQIHPCE